MKIFSITVLLIGLSSAALAVDHSNLDEGRPLRMEDAYAVAHGELTFEAGAGFSHERRNRDRAFFPVEMLYGALPNLQVEIGTFLSTNPHDLHEPEKSGDLELSVLYNFNQETLTVPAFAVKGSVDFPTGTDSSGVDFELTGVITKSFGRLSLHLNAGYEFINGEDEGERDGAYRFVFGSSYPVGAPMHTRTTLLADVFVEQAVRRGDSETVGGEIGFRHQWTERIVVDAGMGSEFAGPADRSPFFAMAGFSIGF